MMMVLPDYDGPNSLDGAPRAKPVVPKRRPQGALYGQDVAIYLNLHMFHLLSSFAHGENSNFILHYEISMIRTLRCL